MRYLITLLVLSFIVALAFKVPIRRAAIGLIIGSLLLLVFAAVQVESVPRPALQPPVANTADNALWLQIRSDQIAIGTQTLQRDANDPASMDYAATFANESDRDADGVTIRIRLYDCPGKPPSDFNGCFIIGDHTEQLAAAVPARGSADISGHFHFDQLRELNNVFAWRAEVARVHAIPVNSGPR